jgi:FkbM family methyltransferase
MWRQWRPRRQLPLQPTLEPVVEVETVAGPLLLPRQDRMITSVLRRYGVWEPAETSYLQAVLRPGQTFVDVGAHVGYFSVLAAKRVGPTGAMIAIEPEPRNLDLLRRNIVRNGCRNVRVVPFAAHSVRGWMSLALDEENRGAHRLVPLHQAGTAVQCVPLDDLLPATVDVVKVDAQGYDHEVIAGLERTIATNPELILITELSLSELGRRGVDPEFVLAGYEALGFHSLAVRWLRPIAQDVCRDGSRKRRHARPRLLRRPRAHSPVLFQCYGLERAPEHGRGSRGE